MLYNAPNKAHCFGMTRNDIHRPGAIIPEDYKYVCFLPHGEGNGLWRMNEMRIWEAHRARTGGKSSQHDHGGNCDICGNVNAMTHVIFYHAKSNAYIRVGETCADKLGMDANAFKATREASERRAGKAKAEATLTAKNLGRSWEVFTRLDAGGEAWEKALNCETIIHDIVSKLVKYGSISEAQENFLRKLESDIDSQAAKRADLATKKSEQRERSKHIGTVGERREFEATIRFSKYFESTGFGGGFTITVLDDADGNVIVWKGAGFCAEKGERVNFKATIKEHGERDGVKQTIITRAKEIATPVAALTEAR